MNNTKQINQTTNNSNNSKERKVQKMTLTNETKNAILNEETTTATSETDVVLMSAQSMARSDTDVTEISAFNTWVGGTISQPKSGKHFSFTANAPNAHNSDGVGTYIIRSRGDLALTATLSDSDLEPIPTVDCGDGENFTIAAELQYGETYWLWVHSVEDVGDFEITVTCLEAPQSGDCCSNSMASATPLTLGTWTEGCICCVGGEDTQFKFCTLLRAGFTVCTHYLRPQRYEPITN